jgi:hypothetical protein
VAYGNTNKYRPVSRSRASGNKGEYVMKAGGIVPPDRARAMKLAMTVTVNTMANQRWICRIQLFNGTSLG